MSEQETKPVIKSVQLKNPYDERLRTILAGGMYKNFSAWVRAKIDAEYSANPGE